MGSMNVVMRSPGLEGGAPERSKTPGVLPSAHPDVGLEALKAPERSHLTTSASQGEKTLAISNSPESSKANVPEEKGSLTSSSGLPKPEYFTDKDKGNSPLVMLAMDVSSKFSKGEIVGGVARAAFAAPLVVGRMTSALVEVGGSFIAVAAVPTLATLVWSGMGFGELLGLCAGGLAVAGAGAFGGYITDRCSHTVRRLFGDTKASWKEALPDGQYPFSEPSSYM